jgi:hypothetical protein
MVAHKEPKSVKRSIGNIPDYLVYEIMDGKPIYYKGYQDVLLNHKTFAEIMGSSSLQAVIVYYLVGTIFKFIDEDIFTVLTSESGLHLNHRNNLSNDIAIFENSVLLPTKIGRKYANVPPKTAIEVDIDADVESMTESGYIHKKTQKLLDFGTEKVIWVLTEPQVVMIATTEKIETFSWHKDIEIFDAHCFNIGQYLDKKGIVVE